MLELLHTWLRPGGTLLRANMRHPGTGGVQAAFIGSGQWLGTTEGKLAVAVAPSAAVVPSAAVSGA